jgi:alkylation response protein AidB-like acyl-CoA dehydrogenase
MPTLENAMTEASAPLLERLSPVLEVAAADAAAVDSEGRYPEAAVTALRQSGLLGLTLTEDVGGLGRGPVEFAEVTQRLASACGSTAMIYLMHVAAAMPLAAHPPSARRGLLASLANGERLATLAFSEKASRSHFWAPLSKASRDGDGIRLFADKSWVTSAGWADVYVVSTLSPDGVAGASDLYVVDREADRVEVSAPWQGMGLRGNASSPMLFDTTVTTGDRLGEEGSAFATMMSVVLPWFNLGNASVTLGLARSALDAAVVHVSGARLEHLGSRLADLPTIRHRLGRAGTMLAAQEAYVRATAASIAAPDDSTLLNVLGSRASANDAALQITDEAMRVCGGAAFSRYLPIERAFRDARAGHVMAPTSDVLYDLYAKAMCGMELF